MTERLEERLQALKKELEAGEKLLADLDAKRLELQQTMLRISGAIQVLEELLAPPREAPASDPTAAPPAAGPAVDSPVGV